MKKQLYEAFKIMLGGIYTGLIIIAISDANFVSDAIWWLILMAVLAVVFLTILFWVATKILKIDDN